MAIVDDDGIITSTKREELTERADVLFTEFTMESMPHLHDVRFTTITVRIPMSPRMERALRRAPSGAFVAVDEVGIVLMHGFGVTRKEHRLVKRSRVCHGTEIADAAYWEYRQIDSLNEESLDQLIDALGYEVL